MIVVEGPDGSGKSTLVSALSERFGLPVSPKLANSDMSKNMPEHQWVEENVARGFQATLFDRHCLISEPIYNSLTKDRFALKFDSISWLNAMHSMFYRGCRPLIIYCLPSYEVVRRNVQTGDVPQPERVIRNVRRIYGLYVSKAASDSALAGAMYYDYTTTPVTELYRKLELAVERMGHVH